MCLAGTALTLAGLSVKRETYPPAARFESVRVVEHNHWLAKPSKALDELLGETRWWDQREWVELIERVVRPTRTV